jgi:quercetin dioxygenase-like cupin family protein
MHAVFLRVETGETITDQERRNVVILAEGPELTITWTRYAGGERGPGLHVHREHVDAFYVLDGELTFTVGPGGAERVSAGAGAFVAVPPNVVHTFVNEGPSEARWLNLHAPDTGFADYLRAARDGIAGAWDSFDPPADGGRPAGAVIVTGAGEGERRTTDGRVLVVKGDLPQLTVVESSGDGPLDAGLYYELGSGRMLGARGRGL